MQVETYKKSLRDMAIDWFDLEKGIEKYRKIYDIILNQ